MEPAVVRCSRHNKRRGRVLKGKFMQCDRKGDLNKASVYYDERLFSEYGYKFTRYTTPFFEKFIQRMNVQFLGSI